MTPTRLRWERPTVRPVVSPTLAALARLQAGTSDTPIHDQLVVQTALRQLAVNLKPALETFSRAMEQAGRNVAAFAARVQEAQQREAAWMAPEAVLDRIRADQASLDWSEAWREERELAAAEEQLDRPCTCGHPDCGAC